MMAGRIIAIGDIHGCRRALEMLLSAIAPTPDDVLIPLGDVIDRGPDTRGAIELLLDLRARCQLRPVLGNHEEMMLAALRGDASPAGWIRVGGTTTLDSYGFRGDLSVVPVEHLDFLASFQPLIETETHFFVHANYAHDRRLDDQPPQLTRWTSLAENFPEPHMSGKTAIVGHTPERSGEILSLRHIKCIDTYCYGGQWLTALDATTGKIWQANEAGHVK